MRVLVPWKSKSEEDDDDASFSSSSSSRSSSSTSSTSSSSSSSSSEQSASDESAASSRTSSRRSKEEELKASASLKASSEEEKESEEKQSETVETSLRKRPPLPSNLRNPTSKRSRDSKTAPRAPPSSLSTLGSATMTAGGRDWPASPEHRRTNSPVAEAAASAAASSENANIANIVLENEPPSLTSNNPIQLKVSRNTDQNVDEDVLLNLTTATKSDDNEGNSYCDMDLQFTRRLKQRGLDLAVQEGDGNCLFRAVALQVYGDPSMHSQVRQQCLDFMARDPQHFAAFIENEDFADYIQRKRQLGVHGNHAEIQACSELFNRPVQVFTLDAPDPLNIFHGDYKTADPPLRLTFAGNHYNAVVDPLVPTAGLGLGLPGLQVGQADKMQVSKAMAESDADADLQKAVQESQLDQLQRALKESAYSMATMNEKKALTLSDLDATNIELEQTALEHSLQSYNAGRKQSPQPYASTSSFNRSSISHAASLPVVAHSQFAPIPAVAAAASAASRASPSFDDIESLPIVQELIMNGFPRQKVIRAYELIGDNFDDLVAFLMQQTHSSR